MPLHPTAYAKLLGEKMKKHQVNVWLINTGWVGGPYGVGRRIKLKYTRAMITAALEGRLNEVAYQEHPIFGVSVPTSCPEVPSELLNPKNTWENKMAYDEKANQLARQFAANFEQFAEQADSAILSGGPQLTVS